jgi:hypothetical protein
LLESGDAVTTHHLEAAIDLRESLRALMLANATGVQDAGAVEVFNRTLEHADLRMHLSTDSKPASD